MFKTVAVAVFMSVIAALANFGSGNNGHWQQPSTGNVPTSESAIKLTIQTARESLTAITDRFHAGDQILVPITMTNTSANPVTVCISSDLYQDMPELKKNGVTVSIMDWQSDVRRGAQRDNTCKELNLPQMIELNPNESQMVDWLVLVDSKIPTGADSWYDPLSPGKYELSIQRRLSCCDGSRVQSNKISFEVLP